MNNKKKAFRYFFISFVTLNIVDALTTSSILSLGGLELNILPSFVISNYGMPGFFLFKLLGSAFLGSLCFDRSKTLHDFLLIMFATICCWNTAMLSAIIGGH